MTLDEIKQTAFVKWLKSVPRIMAAEHIFECLSMGPDMDNLGWALMHAVHGEKFSVNADTIFKAVDAIR